MPTNNAQGVDGLAEVMGLLATMAINSDRWEAVHDVVAELVEAAKGLRFDVYDLTAPELRAAFDGKARIAVVQLDTVPAFRAALAKFPEPRP